MRRRSNGVRGSVLEVGGEEEKKDEGAVHVRCAMHVSCAMHARCAIHVRCAMHVGVQYT